MLKEVAMNEGKLTFTKVTIRARDGKIVLCGTMDSSGGAVGWAVIGYCHEKLDSSSPGVDWDVIAYYPEACQPENLPEWTKEVPGLVQRYLNEAGAVVLPSRQSLPEAIGNLPAR